MKKRNRPGKPPMHPPVTCHETGKTFPTYTEAADDVGCTRWGVMRCCTGLQQNSHNYHFYFDPSAEGDWIGKYDGEYLWYGKNKDEGGDIYE